MKSNTLAAEQLNKGCDLFVIVGKVLQWRAVEFPDILQALRLPGLRNRLNPANLADLQVRKDVEFVSDSDGEDFAAHPSEAVIF